MNHTNLTRFSMHKDNISDMKNNHEQLSIYQYSLYMNYFEYRLTRILQRSMIYH